MNSLKIYTEDTLRGLFERDKERKKLERDARQLEAQNAPILKELEKALRAEGRSGLLRGIFRALFIDGRASVSWKDEFIKLQGAVAAQQLMDAALPKPKLTVVCEGVLTE